MQTSRKLFKTALKKCKNDVDLEKDISMVEKYRNKRMQDFWGDIAYEKKLKKKPNMINGYTADADIAKLLTEQFLRIGGSLEDKEESDFINLLQGLNGTRRMHLTTSIETIKGHIKNLNSGVGHDKLHSRLLKNASDEFLAVLVGFLNSCFSHGHFPYKLLHGIITPILKDSGANCTDSNNYRPVMQSSCILKLAEMSILYVLESYVSLNVRQCGYTKNVSTSDATLILKEVIYRYTRNKNKAFALFMDMSKAFDRVNHLKLCKILLESNVPADIVFLIFKYLRNQSARIKWGGIFGQVRMVGRGVRQGGILSPYLFKVYIDQVLNRICSQNIGCKLGFFRINIIAYADDLVLLAPTLEALDMLYGIGSSMLNDLDLLINRNKSKVMVFSTNNSYTKFEPEVTLHNEVFEVVSSYKYLGHIISHNLSDELDIEYRHRGFNLKFITIKRKFFRLPPDIILFLFKSYCNPHYGINLWNLECTLRNVSYKAFQICYSTAVKSIYGFSKYERNHFIFEICNMLLFRHYLVLVQLKYFRKILEQPHGLIYRLFHEIKYGCYINIFNNVFKEKYDVDIRHNDMDALKSRILYIQRNE